MDGLKILLSLLCLLQVGLCILMNELAVTFNTFTCRLADNLQLTIPLCSDSLTKMALK